MSARSVFINCPYDKAYRPSFWAIVFAVMDAGFAPRAAMELSSAAQTRLDKIVRIIKECDYSIHDLSRLDAPRFNMPFEVGVAIGIANGDERRKGILVLATNKAKFERTCSDLKGIDPNFYRGKPAAATAAWLQQFFRPDAIFPSPSKTRDRFTQFWKKLPAMAKKAGFDPARPTWNEMLGAVHSFLKEHPVRPERDRRARRRKRRR